jgi:hypothetical protein
MTITAIEAHNKILQEAAKVVGKRTKETCEIGKGIRQGDLYIIRINDVGPTKIKGLEEAVNPANCTSLGGDQLAMGTTMGSRHTIREGQASFWTDPRNANPVFGGCVKSAGRWDLEHPEHDDWNMPEGTYGVFYQLDWQTKQRVRD